MTDTKLDIQAIGKRIQNRRKQLGMTQEMLAEMCNLTPQFVSYAESGKREIKICSMKILYSALGTSTDYLLTGDIIDKDKLLLSEKLDKLTGSEVQIIENIIDQCIILNHSEQ